MQINKQIQQQIENNAFNLSSNSVFRHNPIRLMQIGVEKTKTLANKRIGEDLSLARLFQIYNLLMDKITMSEANHKDKFELLAEETIREMYDVPDQININTKIVEQDGIEYDFKSSGEDKKIQVLPDRMKVIQDQVNKRIILNSIVHGSSVMIWSSAYYIVKDKLDKINPRLVGDYDAYSAVVNCLLWMQEPIINEDHLQQQGICELNFEDEELDSKGVNFPVLLMETNKVVMDYIICQGIPKDFSDDELKLYYALADDYEYEVWHSTLSPILYADFLETINTEPENIPRIISKLSKLEYEKLESIFISVQEDKEEARRKLKLYNIC